MSLLVRTSRRLHLCACPVLAKPPNRLISSKTSPFALTGSRQKVANYLGVAVEPKAGKFATLGGRRLQANQ